MSSTTDIVYVSACNVSQKWGLWFKNLHVYLSLFVQWSSVPHYDWSRSVGRLCGCRIWVHQHWWLLAGERSKLFRSTCTRQTEVPVWSSWSFKLCKLQYALSFVMVIVISYAIIPMGNTCLYHYILHLKKILMFLISDLAICIILFLFLCSSEHSLGHYDVFWSYN